MHVDYAELDRLGDEIAELSAHLEAATARLLDRIREQQQALASASKTGDELKEAMKQMKERVPKSRAGELRWSRTRACRLPIYISSLSSRRLSVPMSSTTGITRRGCSPAAAM